MSISKEKTTFLAGRDIIAVWESQIDSARDSLLVVTFKLSSQKALDALIAAKHRGLKIRLILDGNEAASKNSLAKRAEEEGIQILLWPSARLGELHAKFTIIDGTGLITGSFNLSRAADESNTESAIFTSDPDAVEAAAKEFQRLAAQCFRLKPEK